MSEQDLHDSKINARLVGVEMYFDDLLLRNIFIKAPWV